MTAMREYETSSLWQEIAGGTVCLLAVGGYLASGPSWSLVGVLIFCAVLS